MKEVPDDERQQMSNLGGLSWTVHCESNKAQTDSFTTVADYYSEAKKKLLNY